MTIAVPAIGIGQRATSGRQAAALEAVGRERVGMAAGTYYTGRYLGGVVGASLAGAILGAQVTAAGVSAGFAVLATVGVAVAVVLPGCPDGHGRNRTCSRDVNRPRPGSNPLAGLFDSLRGTGPACS